MASLAEIRARLQAQENKGKDREGGGFGDGSMYPHWNINEGESCSIRFLEDGDSTNPFFWVEKAVIKLPFNGIIGGEQKQVVVAVPCMEMWNETCPILTEVRPWFKDPSLEDMGRKYWKKRTYLFQGFVRESGLKEDSPPENPIRKFILGPQLHGIVKAALLDPDLDNLPTDRDSGLDFRVTKTSKGGFANYDTSKWARKESPLTDAERAAIDQYGLFDLKQSLPKKPSSIELSVMQEMFEASVDGKAYDPDKWSAYFRPPGVQGPARSESSKEGFSTPAPSQQPKQESSSTPPWEGDAKAAADSLDDSPLQSAPAGEDKAKAILDMIRSRQTKTA